MLLALVRFCQANFRGGYLQATGLAAAEASFTLFSSFLPLPIFLCNHPCDRSVWLEALEYETDVRYNSRRNGLTLGSMVMALQRNPSLRLRNDH